MSSTRHAPSDAAHVSLWATTGIVLRKELRDHVRDRRSSVGALLFPMLGPLLLVAGVRFGVASETATELEVGVKGQQYAPELMAAIREHGVEVTAIEAPEAAVNSAKTTVVLNVPADYSAQLRAGNVARLEIYFDSSKPKTMGLVRRLEAALNEHIQRLVALRLVVRGVSPIVAQPAAVAAIDLATPERLGARLLNVIPMMLMLSAFAGGMNVAIDVTAGERERKSLEPLLLNSASRLGVVVGKWAAACIASLTVTVLSALMFTWVPPLLPLAEIGMRVKFGPVELFQALLWVAPLGLVGVALEMLIACFARTFKEAQTYLSFFILLPTLPSVFLMFSPLDSGIFTSLVPALAQVTAILELLKGQKPPMTGLLLVWVSTFVYVACILSVIERLLRREKTVFGR
jgi:sodium transport system permease protein